MTVLQDQILAELDLAELNVAAANDRVNVLRQMLDLANQLDGGAGEGADPDVTAPLAPEPASPAASSQPSATAAVGVLPRAAEEHPAASANGRAGDTKDEVVPRSGGNGADAPGELPEGAPGSGPSPAHRPARKTPPADIGPAILKALDQLGQATYQQIAEHAGLILSSVTGRVLTLVDAGQIVCVGTGTRANGTNGRLPRLYALKTVADRKAAELGTRDKGPGGPRKGETEDGRKQNVLDCIAQGAGLVDDQVVVEKRAGCDGDVFAVDVELGADLGFELHEDGTYGSST